MVAWIILLVIASANMIESLGASSTTTSSSSSSLPRMGLGMAALGRPGYITLHRNDVLGSAQDRSVDAMRHQAFCVMDQLWELCRTHNTSNDTATTRPWLDCARSYGLSEQFVGDYLRNRGIAPANVYVSSKWGYTYVADWNVTLEPGALHEIKDHSIGNFLKQLQETRSHLGDYVQLYQIHSATFASGVLTDASVHRALANARNQYGWKLGLSVSGIDQDAIIRAALAIRVPDDTSDCRLFDSVQCTFNLLESKPADALREAHQAGLDIIIKEALANGRALHHTRIQAYAAQLGCTPDQLALAAVLAQDFAPRVLSGAVTPEQLASNWHAQTIAVQLKDNPALLAEMMQACRMPSEEYWQERSNLAWN
jgi:aryl-alcohol dehydrogenase-like predicted oxidoreductase